MNFIGSYARLKYKWVMQSSNRKNENALNNWKGTHPLQILHSREGGKVFKGTCPT